MSTPFVAPQLHNTLLVPATAPRFHSQDEVALVIRVCILLFIALFAGFAIGTKAT